MVFGITDAHAYREKVEADLSNLMAAIADPHAAINACTSTYHLHEWLWAYNLKPMSPPTVRGVVVRDRKAFVGWLDESCPHFSLIQELTNGSKHALPVHSSGAVSGYGAGPYGIGPFGAPYLLIDLGQGEGTARYKVASDVISEASKFMISLAKELGA